MVVASSPVVVVLVLVLVVPGSSEVLGSVVGMPVVGTPPNSPLSTSG